MGAIAAGIIAGAATMFIPVSVLETITGATGLSELVHATAAPLGDKARALIAFGAGALTLAIATILLLRKEDAAETDSVSVQKQEDVDENASGFSDRLSGLKDRLPQIKLPKMPWVKGENEVRDLSDLPSIRSADAHPDAPRRRPLLATKDLPLEAGAPKEIATPPSAAISVEEVQVVETDIEDIVPVLEVETEEPETDVAIPVEADATGSSDLGEESTARQEAAAMQVETANADEAAPQSTPGDGALEDMISRFEAAVERRKQQLAKLDQSDDDALATAPAAQVEDVAPTPDPEVEAPDAKRPPLEAVPDTSEDGEEEMDGALNAALQTLHRMNAQAR